MNSILELLLALAAIFAPLVLAGFATEWLARRRREFRDTAPFGRSGR